MIPVTQLVLQAVLKLGECSNYQVLAEVRDRIPKSQAISQARLRLKHRRRRYHRPKPERHKEYPLQELLAFGQRDLVTCILLDLTRDGKIRHLGRALYAPPLPKLHEPPSSEAG